MQSANRGKLWLGVLEVAMGIGLQKGFFDAIPNFICFLLFAAPLFGILYLQRSHPRVLAWRQKFPVRVNAIVAVLGIAILLDSWAFTHQSKASNVSAKSGLATNTVASSASITFGTGNSFNQSPIVIGNSNSFDYSTKTLVQLVQRVRFRDSPNETFRRFTNYMARAIIFMQHEDFGGMLEPATNAVYLIETSSDPVFKAILDEDFHLSLAANTAAGSALDRTENKQEAYDYALKARGMAAGNPGVEALFACTAFSLARRQTNYVRALELVRQSIAAYEGNPELLRVFIDPTNIVRFYFGAAELSARLGNGGDFNRYSAIGSNELERLQKKPANP
jgi:hypothetical protein